MYIKRNGSGAHVCIGIHGWSGDHNTFMPLVPFIPPKETLYSLDLPGHGKSPHPDRWDLEEITSTIATGIEALDVSQCTIIGMCSGAIIGLLVAEKLKNKVDRLVIIDPFAYMPWYFRVFLNDTWGWYAYASTFANPVGRWITNNALRSKRTADSDLTDSFETIDHKVTYSYLKLLASVDGIEQFRSLSQPIDIVYGENTFGAIKHSLPKWQNLWPHATCREINGVGHFPIKEATRQTSEVIFNT